MSGERANHALRLFAGIADRYEGPAGALTFGGFGRWRAAGVRALDAPAGGITLDVATGTGLVADDLRRAGHTVLGLDQSVAMLAHAKRRELSVVAGQAERLPFPDASMSALSFSYLLRYVEDPAATLAEMARVLKPGAPMVSVEFGVPRNTLLRTGWRMYVFGAFPVAGRLVSRAWQDAARFLGPSILRFDAEFPPEEQAVLWNKAGMVDVRIRRMTFGAGIVMWGRKHG